MSRTPGASCVPPARLNTKALGNLAKVPTHVHDATCPETPFLGIIAKHPSTVVPASRPRAGAIPCRFVERHLLALPFDAHCESEHLLSSFPASESALSWRSRHALISPWMLYGIGT